MRAPPLGKQITNTLFRKIKMGQSIYLLKISIFWSRELSWLFQDSMWRWKLSQSRVRDVKVAMLLLSVVTAKMIKLMKFADISRTSLKDSWRIQFQFSPFTFTIHCCQPTLESTLELGCEFIELVWNKINIYLISSTKQQQCVWAF